MPDQVPLPELAVAPSFREQVLEHLREQIIAGQLAPGSSLTPTALARRLQTSAMPVREALRVLQQEGLVEVSARRFTRVAVPRRDVADEAYPLLGLLEGFSLRQAPTPSATAMAEAEAANEALARATGISERLRADVRFHRAITATAGSTTRAMLSMLYGRIALLEVGYHRTHPPDESVAEHSAILAALHKQDPHAAAGVVEQHWLRGYEAILPLFDDAAEPPESEAQATRRGRRG